MKNTKRKTVMLLADTWKLLDQCVKETGLTASEVINELMQMYWHRWTMHRKKRLQPYKKAPYDGKHTEPEPDEALSDQPHQDYNTDHEDVEKLVKELFSDEEASD